MVELLKQAEGIIDAELLAELGVAVLLFLVGVKLDVKLVRTLGPVSLATGLGTNWVTVAGSSATNQIVLPIAPNNASVFFRLSYP